MRNLMVVMLLSLQLSGCAGVMLTLSGVAGGLSIANSAYQLYDTYLSRQEDEEKKEK